MNAFSTIIRLLEKSSSKYSGAMPGAMPTLAVGMRSAFVLGAMPTLVVGMRSALVLGAMPTLVVGMRSAHTPTKYHPDISSISQEAVA